MSSATGWPLGEVDVAPGSSRRPPYSVFVLALLANQSFDRHKVKKVSFPQAIRALNVLCKIELTAGETDLLRVYLTTDGFFKYKDFAEDIDRGTGAVTALCVCIARSACVCVASGERCVRRPRLLCFAACSICGRRSRPCHRVRGKHVLPSARWLLWPSFPLFACRCVCHWVLEVR